jgi:hypothetical protein
LIRSVYGWLSPELLASYASIVFQPYFDVLNRYTPQYLLDCLINLFSNTAEYVANISPHRTPLVWSLPVE